MLASPTFPAAAPTSATAGPSSSSASMSMSMSMSMSPSASPGSYPATANSDRVPARVFANVPSSSFSSTHSRRQQSRDTTRNGAAFASTSATAAGGDSHTSLASSVGAPSSDSGMSMLSGAGYEPGSSGPAAAAAGGGIASTSLLASDLSTPSMAMLSRSAPSSFAQTISNGDNDLFSLPSSLQPPQSTNPLARISENLGEPLIDWKYEMRRHAQEILPGLFVGPYQSSKSLEELQRLRISHIVCLYEEREAHLVKPRFVGQFQYLPLLVRDASDQNLISLFPAAKSFIDDALKQGGRVLVHCGDGISRSPAIVTAYVMCAMNASHEDAFNHVQSRRFCASPNTNFKRQIEAYESINQATVAMAKYAAASGAGSGGHQQDTSALRRKREDDDGGDMQDSIGNRKRRDLADSDDEEGGDEDDEMDMS